MPEWRNAYWTARAPNDDSTTTRSAAWQTRVAQEDSGTSATRRWETILTLSRNPVTTSDCTSRSCASDGPRRPTTGGGPPLLAACNRLRTIARPRATLAESPLR